MARQRSWAIRCMHESSMHEHSSFVTLTYDVPNCPISLDYRDFQRFMYRLRKQHGPTRFFACGEYGETTRRPHFHALLFGRTWANRDPVGKDLYRSPDLERLWPHGFSSFGAVTYQSAAYVAGYALKKVTGAKAQDHYLTVDWRSGELVELQPEFAHMSLKPGIGYTWFSKYWQEVYGPRDGCVLQGGKLIPAPTYYDRLLSQLDDDRFQELTVERYNKSAIFADDNTPARLAVREIHAHSALKSRSL